MHNLQRRLLRKHFRKDQVPDDYCIVICSVLRKYKKSLLRMMKTKLVKNVISLNFQREILSYEWNRAFSGMSAISPSGGPYHENSRASF